MKKRVYTGVVVFAVLLLALGRLIVRPPRVVRELFMVPGRPRAQRAGAATGAGSLSGRRLVEALSWSSSSSVVSSCSASQITASPGLNMTISPVTANPSVAGG
jgi:hypothetical protein